jgi:hypothetical protein
MKWVLELGLRLARMTVWVPERVLASPLVAKLVVGKGQWEVGLEVAWAKKWVVEMVVV